VSRRVKRKFDSLPYHLQKTYKKATTAKPSTWLIGAALAIVAIFLLGGGMYDLLERPAVVYFSTRAGGELGRPIFFYPYRINEQFLGESLLVMILYVVGVVGLLTTYQATKYAYKPRQAYVMLFIGVTLIVISFAFVELELQRKLTFGAY